MTHHCLILADAPDALIEFCGISVLERLLRNLQRCGVTEASLLSSTPKPIAKVLSRPSWARAQLQVTIRERPSGPVTIGHIADGWSERAASVLVLRGDAVFDSRLLELLAARTDACAIVDSAVPPELATLTVSAPDSSRGKFCGAALIRGEWLTPRSGLFEQALVQAIDQEELAVLDVADHFSYYAPMRRTLRPFWFPAPTASSKTLAKGVLFDSIQKGTLDIPAHVHAPIENFLVSQLCRTSITPNQLTIFCNVIAWITTALFATGNLAWGLALAWIVGVLDGLDGKQARVKVETTKGGKLEHWFDALFEWSWWIALAHFFHSSGQLPGAYAYLALLALAEGVDGILKGRVYLATGKLIDELGTFERIVRLIGGRRNVYIWLLSAGFLLGAPHKAFIAMAWLEAATAAVHLPRVLWVFYRVRKQSPPVPPAPATASVGG